MGLAAWLGRLLGRTPAMEGLPAPASVGALLPAAPIPAEPPAAVAPPLPEIEARIEADPDDVEAYLVYADWLLEHGDPLGELIMVHAELETAALRERRMALIVRGEELIAAHAAAWLGHIAELDESRRRASWRLGFLHSIELDTNLGAEMVAALTKARASRFLRELTLSVASIPARSSWADPEDATDPIPAILEHGLPRTLRRLDLSIDLDPNFYSHEPIDLGGVYARLEQVEDLRLQAPDVLGLIALPRLTRLTIRGFSSTSVDELAGSTLPMLTSLTLLDGPWTSLAGLRLPRSPRLRMLALSMPSPPYFERVDPPSPAQLVEVRAAFEALARAPILARLTLLDLSAAMSAAASPALAACAPLFERHPRLHVTTSSLESEARQAIADRFDVAPRG